MLHGVGTTLARVIDPARLHVLPAPSAFSIACARLGWPVDATPLISRVKNPETPVSSRLRKSGRAIVYVAGTGGASTLAEVLRGEGLGGAKLVIMERLGGPHERTVETTAAAWTDAADPLHLVAVELTPDATSASSGAPPDDRLRSAVPGLPDELYGGDGQLTRAEVRAVALAALAPRDGELLWDVGAGSGTIAIEWCRAAPAATAIAIERREDRAATIAANASALGAEPRVTVALGAAPLALEDLPTPDAIFIGGGPAIPGLIDGAWRAVRPGGRVVANAVTLEGEHALTAAHRTYGGRLIRLELSHAEPLGSFTGWKPQRPVTQWSATKPIDADEPGAA
jgi:precorrin-6Y C5,15-methyltransferase (decarboxylating)